MSGKIGARQSDADGHGLLPSKQSTANPINTIVISAKYRNTNDYITNMDIGDRPVCHLVSSIPASAAYAKPARHRSWLSEKLSGKGTDFKETDVKETKTKS